MCSGTFFGEQVTRTVPPKEFDLSWPKGGLTQKQSNDLSTLAFIERKEDIVLPGPSSLGKTHLMTALEQNACMVFRFFIHAVCSLR